MMNGGMIVLVRGQGSRCLQKQERKWEKSARRQQLMADVNVEVSALLRRDTQSSHCRRCRRFFVLRRRNAVYFE